MSEEPGSGSEAAVFRVEKMYLKDLSFENPNAPDVFRGQLQPKAEVNLGLKNRKAGDEHWEVSLTVTASLKADDTVLFIVEVEHAGLFLLRNIPEEHMAAVLAVECPTVLFPFTRQVICQAVIDGGFVPFLLDPVNFLAMYKNAQQAKQAQQEETSH